MRVDIKGRNTALVSLFENPAQTIFLDANFLIPPDRSRLGATPIAFQKYCEIWLNPVFDEFSGLAMHESVYNELVMDNVKSYADSKKQETPSKLKVYTDSELNEMEKKMMQTYINRISPFSKYILSQENSNDRGEVLSLSYMAAKGFLYFASNDSLPVKLIRNAAELGTGLDYIGLLEMYDVIFCLYHTGRYDNKSLRLLYFVGRYGAIKDTDFTPIFEELLMSEMAK